MNSGRRSGGPSTLPAPIATDASSSMPNNITQQGSSSSNASALCSGGGVGGRNNSKNDDSYLLSLLQALRSAHKTDGMAGISSLLSNNSEGQPFSGGTKSPLATPPLTPSKRRKEDHRKNPPPLLNISVKQEILDNESCSSGGTQNQGSLPRRPASNQSCSSYIAQLSSDIAYNRINSASPSSLSSSSSSSRSAYNPPTAVPPASGDHTSPSRGTIAAQNPQPRSSAKIGLESSGDKLSTYARKARQDSANTSAAAERG